VRRPPKTLSTMATKSAIRCRRRHDAGFKQYTFRKLRPRSAGAVALHWGKRKTHGRILRCYLMIAIFGLGHRPAVCHNDATLYVTAGMPCPLHYRRGARLVSQPPTPGLGAAVRDDQLCALVGKVECQMTQFGKSLSMRCRNHDPARGTDLAAPQAELKPCISVTHGSRRPETALNIEGRFYFSCLGAWNNSANGAFSAKLNLT
jgi:hypothetical protein